MLFGWKAVARRRPYGLQLAFRPPAQLAATLFPPQATMKPLPREQSPSSACSPPTLALGQFFSCDCRLTGTEEECRRTTRTNG